MHDLLDDCLIPLYREAFPAKRFQKDMTDFLG